MSACCCAGPVCVFDLSNRPTPAAVDRYLTLVTSLVHRYLSITSSSTSDSASAAAAADDVSAFSDDLSQFEYHIEQLTGAKVTSKHRLSLDMLDCCTSN